MTVQVSAISSTQRKRRRKIYYTNVRQISLHSGVVDKRIAHRFHPDFSKRLLRLCNLLRQQGFRLKLGSGVRSVSTQRKQRNPRAAKGLQSAHLYGCAADIFHDPRDGRSDTQFYRALRRAAKAVGLQTISGASERPHVQLPRHEFRAGRKCGKYKIVAWGPAARGTTRRRPRRAQASEFRHHANRVSRPKPRARPTHARPSSPTPQHRRPQPALVAA